MLWKKIQKTLSKPTLSAVLGYGNTFQQVCFYAKPANFKGNHLFTSDRGNERLQCRNSGFRRRNEQVLNPEDVHKFYTLATGCAYKPVIFLDFALGASEVTLNTVLSSPH